jgi:hypothetical protein
MKKSGRCAVFFLSEFVLKKGRIRIMLAPVVPMRFARTAPKVRKREFTLGVARRSPDRAIPPEMT